MLNYNKDQSFMENMDALFNALEKQRNEYLRIEEDGYGNRIEEQDQTDKRVVEVITHVQQGITIAKDIYKANPVEAVCEVVNAINISLCDELNIGVLKLVRTSIFGYDDDHDAFLNIDKYNMCLLESVGKEKVMRVDRRCTRCHQEYSFYIPAIWNDGRDAKVIRSDTRRTNTNASYEFMCLSGMCDACWQVCFNKE